MNSINCQNCKKINKSETTYNEFYKCLICNIYLCPLCKTIHDKSHNIINMDKNYICSIHNESYSIYCSDCKINSCIQCFNEKHKNHKKIFFADIMPNMDEINNKMKDLKKSIDIFKQNIEEMKSKLNTLVNSFDLYYKINEEIIRNYRTKERNYEILMNINQINDSNIIINKLNDINNEIDVISKLQKIVNIYKIMNIREEVNDELVMKYHVSKADKKLFIFGSEFVKRNKYLCQIIHEDNEYELTDQFNVENINKDYLEIKLKGFNNINDISYMFYNCSSLISIINKDNLDFKNITNMSSAFLGCSLLESLSTFKEINTKNVTNMSLLFALCNKLDLSFINSWDTSEVKDMTLMFSGCYNNLTNFRFESKSQITSNSNKDNSNILQFQTKSAIHMSGMFSGCLSLTSLGEIDLRNAINMNQIFRGCKSLILDSTIKSWNLDNVKDISGMFSNIALLSNSNFKSISNWNIKNMINLNCLFSYCDSLEKIVHLNWNISNVFDISNLFANCTKLTSISELNLSSSSVTKMSGMFKNCPLLSDISGITKIESINLKYINSMFEGCENLSNLPNLEWNTINIIDMSCLFNNCQKLNSIKGITKWKTENVKNMCLMFYKCEKLSNLKPLKSWNISNVTDMSGMFYLCTSLSNLSGLENWDTGKVTNMCLLFSNSAISSVYSISNWNTKNVINMNSMFSHFYSFDPYNLLLFSGNIITFGLGLGYSVYKKFSDYNNLSDLSGLEKWDTTNVEDMRYMFNNRKKINSLSSISNWNIEKANIDKMFDGCKNDLIIPANFQNKMKKNK